MTFKTFNIERHKYISSRLTSCIPDKIYTSFELTASVSFDKFSLHNQDLPCHRKTSSVVESPSNQAHR